MKDINNYKELIEKQENKIKQREKEYLKFKQKQERNINDRCDNNHKSW